MPSGQYTIDDAHKSRADSSFRACVIAMLIFLLFCVTIIIILLVLKKDAGPESSAEDGHGGSMSKFKADEASKSTTSSTQTYKSASEDEIEKTTSSPPPSAPTPPARVHKSTTETSTFPTSTESTHKDHSAAGGSDSSEDRRASESKDISTSTEYPPSTSTKHPASTSTERSALPETRGSPEGGDVAGDNITSTTDHPASTSTERSALPEIRGSPEGRDVAGDNITSTSTDHPASTSTERSALPETRGSPEGRDEAGGKVTSTSTDHPASTSTERSALPVALGSPEGRDEAGDNVTSTSTELPTTSTRHSASREIHKSSEGGMKSTENITSTSTEPARKTTEHSGSSELHAPPGDETTGSSTSTSTELPTTVSTGSSASSEIRRDSEDSVHSSESLTTSSEHPPTTSEPPITPPAPPLPTSPPVPVPCESSTCKKLSVHILSTMGLDADPCKQFYEYACGGLRQNKYLLEPDYADEAWQQIKNMVDGITASSPESYRKFKTLVESCSKYDPDKDIQTWKEAVLTEMGDLGIIATEDAHFSENFTHLFSSLLQHDRPFIFEVTLDVDDKKPSRFAVKMFPAQMAEKQLHPADNGFPECQAEAVKKYKHLNLIYKETLNCMNKGIGRMKAMEAARESLITLGIFRIPDEEEKLNKTLQEYGEFLDISTQALGERATLRLELENRNPDLKTIKELNRIFEDLHVEWSTVFEKLIGRELKEDESIQIYSIRYFDEINLTFKTRRRQLHNALLVAFAAARYHELVAEPRWRRHAHPLHCTRLAAHLLPDVASALYLSSFSDALRAQLGQQANDFVFDFVSTFLDELDRSPWLEEDKYQPLKENLGFKMETLRMSNVTDARELRNTDKLDAALTNHTINENEFIQSALTLMARNRKRLYERIDEEPINHIWTHFILPYDTTGLSLYSLNIVAIPLGAIQKPFFDPGYLLHIQMAGYGFTVAHEMAHHIDPIGIQFNTSIEEALKEEYDKELPSYNLWKKEVNIEYMNMTEPAKYQNVTFDFTSDNFNLKTNEFFADKIGIQLAYKTYKKIQKKKPNMTLPYLPLTNDQSFFVFLAQKYCTKLDYFTMVIDFFESPEFPQETRVKNIMEDNAAFYRAFNCNITKKTDSPFPYSNSVGYDHASEGRLLR